MPSLTRPIVRSVVFDPDGSLVIEYCIPAQDARSNGVVLNHLLSVPDRGDYDDEMDAVMDAVQALLVDVLEDFPTMAPLREPAPRAPRAIEVTEDDDDDDDL